MVYKTLLYTCIESISCHFHSWIVFQSEGGDSPTLKNIDKQIKKTLASLFNDASNMGFKGAVSSRIWFSKCKTG